MYVFIIYDEILFIPDTKSFFLLMAIIIYTWIVQTGLNTGGSKFFF